MVETGVSSLERTYHKTNEWLHELSDEPAFDSPEQACTGFRAVLHALRDRLTVDEAAHLASQLPMLIRGFYYEDWKPSKAPKQERTQDEFIAAVDQSLGTNDTIDRLEATRSVFRLVDRKLSQGQVDDIKTMLPKDNRQLWDGK